MIFSRDYVDYLARRTVKHLIDAKLVTTSDMKVTHERVHAALVDELSLEDRINDEVRVILEAYSDEMRKSGMRISRDKLNKLAHTVADTLAEIEQVGFLEDRNTIRQEARKALEALLAEEHKIDASARLKIANQRKIILEGSQEWDILYRKYYNEEVRKLGI
jgi:hypothetical protein